MLTAWIEPGIKSPGQYNPKINANITQGDAVAWVWNNLLINGSPFHLTGYLATMTIQFPTPLTLTSSNGGITIGTAPNDNAFTINMTSTQTASFISGEYPYDIWLESQLSPPIENQYFTGTFSVSESIKAVP